MPKGIYKRSEKIKQNLREKIKILWQNPIYKQKHLGSNHHFYGKQYSEDAKRKMSENSSLRKNKGKTYEQIYGQERAKKIKKKIQSDVRRMKSSITHRKRVLENKCHLGDGTKTLFKNKIVNLLKYRQWRSDIFTRDNFICQECDIRGGKLNVHHIKAFALILKENNIKTLEQALNCEELWNINNGTTLCEKCHKKIHI